MNSILNNTFKLFSVLALTLCTMQACDKKQEAESVKQIESNTDATSNFDKGNYTTKEYNNTKGYYENGDLITQFDCPDDKSFPPVDVKSWKKVPVVNGRFPTYAETMNGTAIHHYGEKESQDVKPFDMTLPRLAYRKSAKSKMDDLVIVIQIVQTAKDTVVGYRYLSGGCGGSKFHNFQFLSDKEIKVLTK